MIREICPGSSALMADLGDLIYTPPSTANEFFYLSLTISSASVDASAYNHQSTRCYFLTGPSVVSFMGLLLFPWLGA